MYGCVYNIYRPLVDGFQACSNLANCGDGNGDGSSKTDPSRLVPSVSSNDDYVAHTPYNLD